MAKRQPDDVDCKANKCQKWPRYNQTAKKQERVRQMRLNQKNFTTSTYRWIIKHDHSSVGSYDVGIEGPSNADDELTAEPAHFMMYDDDHELYYEGTLFGRYGGFEPLDDFGTPNAGCTMIKINGKWL